MTNTHFIYVISFLFFSVAGTSQVDSLSTIEDKHKLFVTLDAAGLTFLPLSTVFFKNEISHYRLLPKLQYEHDERWTIDLAYGYDHWRAMKVRKNFTDYELTSNYVQTVFNIVATYGKDMSLMAGPGLIYGRIQETGVIEIGGDYFDPFQERLTLDQKFFGWILSAKGDWKLDEKWSFEIDIRVQSMRLSENDSVQVIHAMPGGQRSWLHSRNAALAVNRYVSLKYRIW